MSDRDLFGERPKAEPVSNPKGLIRLPLIEVPHASTSKAVFLTMFGPAEGHHVARSLVGRGVGPEINTWTVPRWLARQNGWL